MLKQGENAPLFNKGGINLEDYKGSIVVLYFYPKDNTPGCILEARDFSSKKDEFEACGAKIIGISRDSEKSHQTFTSLCSISFPLVSDTDESICKMYGVLVEKSMFGKKYMGLQRSTFLIDKSGKIAFIWDKVSVLGHGSAVLAKIKELGL